MAGVDEDELVATVFTALEDLNEGFIRIVERPEVIEQAKDLARDKPFFETAGNLRQRRDKVNDQS